MQNPPNVHHYQLPQADMLFVPDFFSEEESQLLLEVLKEKIEWQQGRIRLFGKEVLEPRLTAWYGDEGKTYTYSGKRQGPLAWISELLDIKKSIEAFHSPHTFNSVLLNYYRHGNDSMGYHSDDERELGKNPIIASLNLGEARRFLYRSKDNHQEKGEILLTSGSLLIMQGEMQHFWQHAIPKAPKKTNSRINLTFRQIM